MEEAKIEAYRVQITDLETGEEEVDEITPAVLCTTLTNATDEKGAYHSILCSGKGTSALADGGLFKAVEEQKKEVDDDHN